MCKDYFQRDDSGIDLQSLVSIDSQNKREDNSFGYEFHSEEFLNVQPISSYVLFLKPFIHGMKNFLMI